VGFGVSRLQSSRQGHHRRSPGFWLYLWPCSRHHSHHRPHAIRDPVNSESVYVPSCGDARGDAAPHSKIWCWICPPDLPDSVQPATIRSLLVTSREITHMSLRCLELHLGRFNRLRPEVPVDKEADFSHCGSPKNPNIYPWASRPEGRKVHTRRAGPPCWAEDQRVIRAFWRFQLIYDLKRAVAMGLIRWSPESIAELERCAAISYPETITRMELQQLPRHKQWLSRRRVYFQSLGYDFYRAEKSYAARVWF
jgi:hypothetical protein